MIHIIIQIHNIRRQLKFISISLNINRLRNSSVATQSILLSIHRQGIFRLAKQLRILNKLSRQQIDKSNLYLIRTSFDFDNLPYAEK